MTSAFARQGFLAALLAATFCLAACSKTPPSADPALDAEGFPSVYRPLYAATTQMTTEEAEGQQRALSGLAARRASGSISEAEYRRRVAEMRALGANHGADTLKQMNN
ncbi:SHOCT domain-containing protein [Rhizobium sp. SG2393]|uniref:SHOCT domain-containing protein n=1 Tax=Rhizobium sp. SG2393 TaxID=3276279 RepID=UPI003671C48C